MIQSDHHRFALQSTTIARIERDKASSWHMGWPAEFTITKIILYVVSEDVWMDI